MQRATASMLSSLLHERETHREGGVGCYFYFFPVDAQRRKAIPVPDQKGAEEGGTKL